MSEDAEPRESSTEGTIGALALIDRETLSQFEKVLGAWSSLKLPTNILGLSPDASAALRAPLSGEPLAEVISNALEPYRKLTSELRAHRIAALGGEVAEQIATLNRSIGIAGFADAYKQKFGFLGELGSIVEQQQGAFRKSLAAFGAPNMQAIELPTFAPWTSQHVASVFSEELEKAVAAQAAIPDRQSAERELDVAAVVLEWLVLVTDRLQVLLTPENLKWMLMLMLAVHSCVERNRSQAEFARAEEHRTIEHKQQTVEHEQHSLEHAEILSALRDVEAQVAAQDSCGTSPVSEKQSGRTPK